MSDLRDQKNGERENDGPSLGRYMETRLNLLVESIKAIEARLGEKISEADRRYEQRFNAQMEAILKSDIAQEKRFESVNEFRKLVNDRALEYIPRKEVERGFDSLGEKIISVNSRIELLEKRVNYSQGEVVGTKSSVTDNRAALSFNWSVIVAVFAGIMSLLAFFKK